MPKPTLKEFFSIPNVLSYFRILLVPVFVYVYFFIEKGNDHFISVSILAISSFTDFLDGYIARTFNMITDWGKLIDPIADKLTQLIVAIALVSTYKSYALIIAVILVKDGILLFFHYYVYKNTGEHIDGAHLPGKIATAAFFASSLVLLAFRIPGTVLASILIDVTFIMMLIALLYYFKIIYGYYLKTGKN